MGIRFLCEACGTKLNIKEDLAGKKGRCPKCNEKILIPMRSTLQKTVEPDKVSAPVNPSKGDPQQASEDSIRGKSSSPVDHSGGRLPATPQGPLTAVSAPAILEKQVVDSGSGNIETQDKSAPELPPTPTAETPEIPRPKSAFDEAPDASWFVRPTSGGQFGPADASTMKSWLSEGRVGRDSLVWREGWEEWESAEKTFDLEFQGIAESTSSTPPVTSSKPASTSGSNIAYHQMARRKAKTMGIILIVALVLLTIVLAVLLVLVANGTIGGAPKTNAETESTLSSPASVTKAARTIC